MLVARYPMSTRRDSQADDPADERDSTTPLLRSWWMELSFPAKVLIPLTGAMLVFVTANALPAFVF
jgi:hypothetical protein